MCTVALRGMNITKDLQDKYNKNLMDLSTVGGSSFGEDDQTTDTTDDEVRGWEELRTARSEARSIKNIIN